MNPVRGLLEGFEGLPVTVKSSDRGRVVMSTAALPADTTICASSLFAASALQEDRNRVCGLCLHTAARKLEDRCGICQQIWFCSAAGPDCAPRAAQLPLAPHSQVCPGLAHLASARFDKQLVAMLRLMIELLYIVSVGACGPFDELVYHPIPPEERADLAKPFELLRRAVSSCEWGSRVEEALSTDRLEKMFSRIETNVHGLFHGAHEQLVGHSVYPSAAMFNHSCNPNCKVGGDQVAKLVITTAVPVLPATELTVSYIALNMPVAERRRALRRQYNFECNCERCLAELGKGKNESVNATQRELVDTAPIIIDQSRFSKQSKLKLLKPSEMKAVLKGLGLSTQGSKKELLSRLLACRDKAYEIDVVNATQNKVVND